jgi:hypothetical protein
MAAALRSGDHAAHGYKSRSELIQALALAFVNAQTSEDDFIGALLDPKNAAGDKLRPRGTDGASRYLHVCWRKAQERAGAQPAIAGRDDAVEAIVRMQAIAHTYPWPSRRGAYDCALLEAHFAVAARAGGLMYHADVRTLAVGAGMSIGTVSKGNRRLRDAGWLRLVKGSRWWAGEATVWRLQIPRRAVPDGNTPITHPQPAAASAMDQSITGGNIPTNAGGDAGECFREERQAAMVAEATGHSADQGADVWRHGALGKASFSVWQHLHPHNSQTANDLAKVIHRTPASIRKQLLRLESWKLAIRDNAGAWLRGGGDPDHAAWILGTLGEGERQRRRHEGDRETFRLGRHVERLRRASGGVAAAAAVSEGQDPAGHRDARATYPRGRRR